MPKRRMTPKRKAAIAKWQRAGAAARKSSGTLTLYHRTSGVNAQSILKQGQFISKQPDGRVWFSAENLSHGSIYGKSAVSIRVPKRKARLEVRDVWSDSTSYTAYTLSPKALQGIKIRRVPMNKREKKMYQNMKPAQRNMMFR